MTLISYGHVIFPQHSHTHTRRLVVVFFCEYFIRQDRKQDQWEFTVQAQLAVGFKSGGYTHTHTHTHMHPEAGLQLRPSQRELEDR